MTILREAFRFDAAWNLPRRTNNGVLTSFNVDGRNQFAKVSGNIIAVTPIDTSPGAVRQPIISTSTMTRIAAFNGASSATLPRLKMLRTFSRHNKGRTGVVGVFGLWPSSDRNLFPNCRVGIIARDFTNDMKLPRPWLVPLSSIIAILVLLGCGSGSSLQIERAVLPKLNPTSYVFNASIDAVKDAIKEVRGEKWHDAQAAHEGGELAWKEDNDPFAKNVLSHRGNEDDAFLYGMGDAVGPSMVYFKKGKPPLTYYADFHIHLTKLDAAHTRVDVRTYNSRVCVGTEWLPTGNADIIVDVPPTTIEEYRILLDVGKHLATTNMPSLVLPEPTTPKETMKVMRTKSKGRV